ncbi:hypothetical protein, partial [Neptuniibacter caesariensis]|uniref:hypothetical protein n=1 Tax=Neptuniibacter caesariensis TaxID=207954 RepID=UPI001EE376AA
FAILVPHQKTKLIILCYQVEKINDLMLFALEVTIDTDSGGSRTETGFPNIIRENPWKPFFDTH